MAWLLSEAEVFTPHDLGNRNPVGMLNFAGQYTA